MDMNQATVSIPQLSICIATFKRGDIIRETLQSIVNQLDERCELVIVDGASPDQTEQVVQPFVAANPNVRYVREATNSGIDQDYDKAICYARGEYCWLMSDDDLLIPGAVSRILNMLTDNIDLVVVNSEIRNADLTDLLQPSFLSIDGDEVFDAERIPAFFKEAGKYLSFIGCVVIRRSLWMSRVRESFFGTLFIHVGTIFQAPAIRSARIVREPLIIIRYGNAMWTARGFEIWMFKWPTLIGSLSHFSPDVRRAVSLPEPFRSPKQLLWYRALGGYSVVEYDKFLRGRLHGFARAYAFLVAHMPGKAANTACAIYYWIRLAKPARMEIYDLSRARNSTSAARSLARHKGIR
jgi:glycosyltransferase involved in cell wall biosynthesis